MSMTIHIWHRTDHIINPDFLQFVSNMLFEEVIGTPCIDVHVSTHGDELRSGQVVERDIVVEELGDSNNVSLRGGLSR